MELMSRDEAKGKAAALRTVLRTGGTGQSAEVRKLNPNRYERERPDEKRYVVAIVNRVGYTLRQLGAQD